MYINSIVDFKSSGNFVLCFHHADDFEIQDVFPSFLNRFFVLHNSIQCLSYFLFRSRCFGIFHLFAFILAILISVFCILWYAFRGLSCVHLNFVFNSPIDPLQPLCLVRLSRVRNGERLFWSRHQHDSTTPAVLAAM